MLKMAISGVDIALWDIFGQAVKTQLHRLLGGYRDEQTAYASAGFHAGGKDASALADEVASYAERGFEWVKIKVGRNPDLLWNPLHQMNARDFATATFEADIERVQAARNALGTRARLAINANNDWSPAEALRFMDAIGPKQIAWHEEPVATENRRGIAEVAQALTSQVAGYETETELA
jgi:L-alanine-DL-glutamate epimerase-like enolase superfamily enzyme